MPLRGVDRWRIVTAFRSHLLYSGCSHYGNNLFLCPQLPIVFGPMKICLLSRSQVRVRAFKEKKTWEARQLLSRQLEPSYVISVNSSTCLKHKNIHIIVLELISSINLNTSYVSMRIILKNVVLRARAYWRLEYELVSHSHRLKPNKRT